MDSLQILGIRKQWGTSLAAIPVSNDKNHKTKASLFEFYTTGKICLSKVRSNAYTFESINYGQRMGFLVHWGNVCKLGSSVSLKYYKFTILNVFLHYLIPSNSICILPELSLYYMKNVVFHEYEEKKSLFVRHKRITIFYYILAFSRQYTLFIYLFYVICKYFSRNKYSVSDRI